MSADVKANMHVAVVMLNYNSAPDLMVSAPQFAAQSHIDSTLILVDNASTPECVAQIRSWLLAWRPDAVVGAQAQVDYWIENNPIAAGERGRLYFITHHENRGYSAGNNIGIRLADKLGAGAVLIANPDMRVEDTTYVATVMQHLFADERHFVAASRILGLDGKDQNPLRESHFWEEVLWPHWWVRRLFSKVSYVLPISSTAPVVVPKVSGCCLMLRMSYLRKSGYLDEGVFLYCEEPILVAKVRKAGGVILYVPAAKAIHAHVAREKGNSSKRILKFIESRRYYLNRYSGYGGWQLRMLFASYVLLAAYVRIKGVLKK